MFVSDLLTNHPISPRTLYMIRTKCSSFISESNSLPIFKRLDFTYGTSSKVKVRHSQTFATNRVLDDAFSSSIENTIVPVTTQALDFVTPSDEWYYVFPTNGYKFLYSEYIPDYRYLIATMESKNVDRSVMVEAIRETYTNNEQLSQGIGSSVEIMLYGLQSFYVVSCSAYPIYTELLSIIRQS